MDKIRHKTLRDALLIVSDTPRKVDADGFVQELTEFEVAKCAGIPYCFEVVSDVVTDEAEETPEDAEPVEATDKPAPAKRGRPVTRR